MISGLVIEHAEDVLTLLNDEGELTYIALTEESEARWRAHLRKLERSHLPVVSVVTTLEFKEDSGTHFGINGIASLKQLLAAKTAREEMVSDES
jgi:hypothetical protein